MIIAAVVFGWESDRVEVDEGAGEVELCVGILQGTISLSHRPISVVLVPGVGIADVGLGKLVVSALYVHHIRSKCIHPSHSYNQR